jgi:hypothetical protein
MGPQVGMVAGMAAHKKAYITKILWPEGAPQRIAFLTGTHIKSCAAWRWISRLSQIVATDLIMYRYEDSYRGRTTGVRLRI